MRARTLTGPCMRANSGTCHPRVFACLVSSLYLSLLHDRLPRLSHHPRTGRPGRKLVDACPGVTHRVPRHAIQLILHTLATTRLCSHRVSMFVDFANSRSLLAVASSLVCFSRVSFGDLSGLDSLFCCFLGLLARYVCFCFFVQLFLTRTCVDFSSVYLSKDFACILHSVWLSFHSQSAVSDGFP